MTVDLALMLSKRPLCPYVFFLFLFLTVTFLSRPRSDYWRFLFPPPCQTNLVVFPTLFAPLSRTFILIYRHPFPRIPKSSLLLGHDPVGRLSPLLLFPSELRCFQNAEFSTTDLGCCPF